jgi:hypothetical protein
MNDTSDVLSKSVSETRRRQRATVTGGESTLDDNSGYIRPFQTDDQKFVLWNLANKDLPPRALMPAFRLLGLFPDMETTMAHVEEIMAIDKSCSLRVATTHEWYTIPESDTPIEESRAKVHRNLLHHQNVLQGNATEFKERHDALTDGRTPAIAHAEDAQAQMETEDRNRNKRKEIYRAMVEEKDVSELKREYDEGIQKDVDAGVGIGIEVKPEDDEGQEEEKNEGENGKEGYKEPPLVAPVAPETLNENWDGRVKELGAGKAPKGVSRMVEVRNQRYAVVSVLRDHETANKGDPVGSEPGVIVWAAFDTEEEAIKYNRVIASKHMKDHDLAVVSMYEWLYPHMMNSDMVNQLYRNEELDNIMKQARTSSTRVHEFEQMCEKEGIECPVMEVPQDLAEPAPRVWSEPTGSELDDHSLTVAGKNLDLAPDINVAEYNRIFKDE